MPATVARRARSHRSFGRGHGPLLQPKTSVFVSSKALATPAASALEYRTINV